MLSPTLPLAFDIASPAMLGWLLAAAAPLLIHLWSRRRYREMSWAAMQFLLAAIRSSRRRMRLEQWLLLAIRTLLIVLVVLAVAEPFLERGMVLFAAGERTHRLLVLDGSYSMAYTPTDKSRFDRAKELAAQIVDESPPGDGFTLVLLSDPPRPVIGNPVFEPKEFLEELDNLRLPHTTADLPRTLAAVGQVLDAARRSHPRFTRHEIYFLTDLGRVGWSPPSDPTALAEFRRQSKQLADSATLVVIDLGQPGAENVALTGVAAAEPFATIARNVEVRAELRNFGRQVRSRQPVELLVDGRRVAQQHVELSPDGEAAATFSYRFDAPGDHILEVRTEGDLLDVDNHRWLAVPVKPYLHVLCVNGRPAGEPFCGATDYLFYALSPQSGQADRTLVHPEVVPESALLELDLGRYDCVFLANVAQFTSSEARVLEAYLKRGGSLVFFLGDRVLADRYNRELGQGQGGVGLLPARLGSVVEKAQYRLDPLEYRHPIVQAFRGQERAGLLTTPVEKYFKLSVPKELPAKVALALGNGDPLIVETPVHQGRVILVATAADVSSWTHMPVWPSYVPLVQELLSYAVGGQIDQRNLEVGQPLGATVSTAAGDVPLVIEGPQGRSDPIRIQSQGDYSGWSYADTSTSGPYAARFGPPVSRTDWFALNVDTAESDLAQFTPDELRGEVWPDVPFVHQTTWESLEEQPVTTAGSSSRLPKTLLYAVLGLLFLETFLAWRFGYHVA
ncbi:MAG: BatA domain-containing protein [Pirellulales bacterium]|nr:BatA domain-containing protein [Pirellulales bacterium]